MKFLALGSLSAVTLLSVLLTTSYFFSLANDAFNLLPNGYLTLEMTLHFLCSVILQIFIECQLCV